MISTLREKLNETVSRVPYLGKVFTTEITGTGLVAGVLAAGMFYASTAKAEPWVDTRSPLIRAEQGQMCLDAQELQFHYDSNAGSYSLTVLGENFSRFLGDLLTRKGYQGVEGRSFWEYRGGRPSVSVGENRVPRIVFDWIDRRGESGFDVSIVDIAGRDVLKDTVAMQSSIGQGTNLGVNRQTLEAAIPPSCEALIDGRVPAAPATPPVKNSDCVCPPAPACEPAVEIPSEQQESPQRYRVGECLPVNRLEIVLGPNIYQGMNSAAAASGRDYFAVMGAFENFLRQHKGYTSTTLRRLGEEGSGPFIELYHAGDDFPGVRGAEILKYFFALKVRSADRRTHYARFTYQDAMDLAQGKASARRKFEDSIPPSCSLQDKETKPALRKGDRTK